jgi:DNA-binding PadR family transcriptional regulator
MSMKNQWLLHVADMNRKGFAVALPGRLYPRKVARALVADGLLEETSAVVCDGDGFALELERERVGYALTEEGRAAVARLNADEQDQHPIVVLG